MPIDVRPDPEGTIRLESSFEGMLALVLTGAELIAARRDHEQLYISHFATCPQADRFRRKKNVRVVNQRRAA
jgi:hypothetical protein